MNLLERAATLCAAVVVLASCAPPPQAELVADTSADGGGGASVEVPPEPPPQPAAPEAPTPAPAPLPATPEEPAWPTAPAAAAQPVRVRVPQIGVDAPLVEVGLNPDQSMEVPDEARVAGWYRHAPRPGELGPAIIAGHNSWKGTTGVFLRLHHLAPGDRIEVEYDNGHVVAFAVDRLEQHPKNAFPSAEVYGDTTAPELRLITCGGVFDSIRRTHLDNVIVFAHLADGAATG